MGSSVLTSQGTVVSQVPSATLHPVSIKPTVPWQMGKVEGQGILPTQPRTIGQGTLRDSPAMSGSHYRAEA